MVGRPANAGVLIVPERRRGDLHRQHINANSTPVRLTHSPGLDINPFFSPDRKQIVFVSEREGKQELYVMNADGSNQRRLAKGTFFIHFHPWYDNESLLGQVQLDPSRYDFFDYYRIFVAEGRMQKLNTLNPVNRIGGMVPSRPITSISWI